MTPRRKELDVLVAAEAWWATKRPILMTASEHIEESEINCVSGAERALANAVARLVTP